MANSSISVLTSPQCQTKPQNPEDIYELSNSRMRALFRDFALLLWQQMYFLGRDVIHPEENLLCKNGFEKRKSKGLTGTSCYRKHLDQGGLIELHGACAGFYDTSGHSGDNFLYIRNRKRIFLYTDDQPPAPGFYPADALRHGPAIDVYFASLKFLDWWLSHENWIKQVTSDKWRLENFEAFTSLPGSRPSLPPNEATLWLRQYRDNPAKLERVSDRLRSIKESRRSLK